MIIVACVYHYVNSCHLQMIELEVAHHYIMQYVECVIIDSIFEQHPEILNEYLAVINFL